MLRTMVIALTLALPGVAMAEQANQFPDSAIGVDVRGDDGTVIGRVDAVERDRHGRIVAAEISNQEPGDAPFAPSDLVASNDDQALAFTVRDDRRNTSRQTQTRAR